MIHDRDFRMLIAKASFADTSETLKLRLDLEPTDDDWAEWDSRVHVAIGNLAGTEIGLGTMHFLRKMHKYDLRIRPEGAADDVEPMVLSNVEFAMQIIIARRVDRTPGKQEHFWLQLSTSIPRTPDKTEYFRRFFQQPMRAHFMELDPEMGSGGGGDNG